MINRALLLAGLCLLIAQDAHAQYSFPGGLNQTLIAKQGKELPEAKFGTQNLLILDQGRNWRVMTGLGLDVLPGEYVIYFKHSVPGSSGEHIAIFVEQKDYQFSESDSEHSYNDHKIGIPKSLSQLEYSNTSEPKFPLMLPADGDWRLDFGRKYIRNNEIHSIDKIALQLAGDLEIRAPQDAIVSNIESSEDGLKTIILDHGRNLYSVIDGINDTSLTPGRGVKLGQVIGRAGTTIDSIGTFLTWQIVLNNAAIDPNIVTEIR